MVFCNKVNGVLWRLSLCHNPYFNRWFSAILEVKRNEVPKYSHNPYFNRWFSAICISSICLNKISCHNPYFNRWFSAIINKTQDNTYKTVTILILIDGFLQYP